MIDESPSAIIASPPAPDALDASKTVSHDDSAGLQPHFPSESRQDAPKLETFRRRSSNISDYSLKDAKNAIQTSTEDLLYPRINILGNESTQTTSPWHSAPLAFALLPALAGILFTNGSGIVTDVMLLGLAAIFLNWSVRLPWDWYHAAQVARNSHEGIRKTETYKDRLDDDTSLRDVPEEEEILNEVPPAPIPIQQCFSQSAAAGELSRHESLALLSCFLFPILGAYLLHSLRSQLERPSDGLVSNYNLTIFLLASELRPVAHVVKLIQSRTLVLRNVVASKSHDSDITTEFVRDLCKRLENLEAQHISNGKANLGTRVSEKNSNLVTMEVRRNLQPDIDALNRAVRRYEKRATVQAFQTDSRLQELESRLNDYISLAAAAAANNRNRRQIFIIDMIEWALAAIVQPFRIVSSLVSLPLSLINLSLQDERKWNSRKEGSNDNSRKPISGKFASKTSLRPRDTFQGKGNKKF
ncbi:hypothetical protein EV44_g2120 [Erysiphe necator]|uniref:Uncharacterized protein n=1 Tax=Uncinula necator TaxID=52586 RepID=A0A0B1P2Q6_UNCNE|nr:hypothetical protein EV44_g2120 [Erysiphe necator]